LKTGLIFHRLIRNDLRIVLNYYEEVSGPELAKRFFEEFEELVTAIQKNPSRFHPISSFLRRANFRSFPYHLLFRANESTVWILVLRHHRRHPSYGVERK
jgi:plasmid stabilization system protein ParE